MNGTNGAHRNGDHEVPGSNGRSQLHANARSTPASRRVLVQRVLEEGWRVGIAAEAVGLSRKSASKWIARYRSEGDSGLVDRRSTPGFSPRRTSTELVSRIIALRQERLVAWAISRALGVPRSTVGAILRRNGLGRLGALEKPAPIAGAGRAEPDGGSRP